MEADGQLQPAPHRRGLQGARHAADPANGAAEEEAEITLCRSSATPGKAAEVSDCFHNVIGVCVFVCTDYPHIITKATKNITYMCTKVNKVPKAELSVEVRCLSYNLGENIEESERCTNSQMRRKREVG